jgi:ribosomal protein S2
MAVVDTNMKSQSINLAIPGNDESFGCIVYYNEVISNYILLSKFNLVFLWYVSVRNKKRLIDLLSEF